jgi:hypothetical protein
VNDRFTIEMRTLLAEDLPLLRSAIQRVASSE